MENIIRPPRKGGCLCQEAVCSFTAPRHVGRGRKRILRTTRKARGEGRSWVPAPGPHTALAPQRLPPWPPKGHRGVPVTRILTPAPALGEEGSFVLTKKIKWKQEEAPPAPRLPLCPSSGRPKGQIGGLRGPPALWQERLTTCPRALSKSALDAGAPGVSAAAWSGRPPPREGWEDPQTRTAVPHGQGAHAPDARSPLGGTELSTPRAPRPETRGDSREAPARPPPRL